MSKWAKLPQFFENFKASTLFSGPSPWGSIGVFLAASVCAFLGVIYSPPTVNQRWWLLAGWLLASIVVLAATNNAATVYEEAKQRAHAAQPALQTAAQASNAIYAQYLAISQAASLAAQAAAPGPAGDAVRISAQAALEAARLAADRAREDAVAAMAPSGSGDADVVAATLIMNMVVFIVSGLLVVSFWNAGHVRQWVSSILWSVACLLLGGFSGFLFGIPRRGITKLVNRLSGSQEAAGAAEQSPIEQIADWLTKTIVGVGLINLKALPDLIHRWAVYVAAGSAFADGSVRSFPENSVASFSAGLIIYFVLLGFLGGYLMTQMFLQAYVNKAN